jgi:hypothetical protein
MLNYSIAQLVIIVRKVRAAKSSILPNGKEKDCKNLLTASATENILPKFAFEQIGEG